jgi:hypothetical protein
MVKLIWKEGGREISVKQKMVFNKGEVDEICTSVFLPLTHGKNIKMKEGYWKEDDSLLFVLMYAVRC